MHIQIEDRDPPTFRGRQLCGKRRIVKVTEAARKVARGVIPGGPSQLFPTWAKIISRTAIDANSATNS